MKCNETKATCHINFLGIILYKNILAKFFENHSQEIEKNTENVSLPLEKIKIQNSPKQRATAS